MEVIDAEKKSVAREWVRDLFPFVMLVLSGLIWGMKLESRIDRSDAIDMVFQKELTLIDAELRRGVLPRAEERLNYHSRRLDQLEEMCREHDLEGRVNGR